MGAQTTGSDVNHGAKSVTTTATAILAGRSARESLLVQNLGSVDVYVGGSTVTTATGIKVAANESLSFDEFVGTLYGIVAAGACDVRFFEVY